jgi:hypothetical protein
MTEEEWLKCEGPKAMLTFVFPRASDRRLRLVACGFCNEKSYRFTEEEMAFVETAEQYADGMIGDSDREAAYQAARLVEATKGRADPLTVLATECLKPASGDFEFGWHRIYPISDYSALRVRLLRDIFGNPFRAVTFSPEWRTDTAVTLARQMYESREFGAMPILADALQDAGCDSDDILSHCRDTSQTHVRGCWVVDLVLGKE